jgi:hypothetical protein
MNEIELIYIKNDKNKISIKHNIKIIYPVISIKIREKPLFNDKICSEEGINLQFEKSYIILTTNYKKRKIEYIMKL